MYIYSKKFREFAVFVIYIIETCSISASATFTFLLSIVSSATVTY